MFRRRPARSREADVHSSDLSLKIVGQVTEAVMEQVAKNGHGIHIDTALAGCAATAGTLLLRGVAGDSLLATLDPGSYVIHLGVDDAGPRLLGLITTYATAAHVKFEPSDGEVPIAVGSVSGSIVRLHGGHIVAVSLGGFSSGPNLFPQDHNFNTSAYARLEHGWRRALSDGCSVEVDIALTLDPDPFVPQLVIVTCWENGKESEHPLLNEPKVQ